MSENEVYIFPASFAQRRLWFLDQLNPEAATTYNVMSVQRLRGPLQADVLERSLNEIVRRHESLRTYFDSGDGDPMQVVEAELPGVRITITEAPGDETRTDAEVERIVAAHVVQEHGIPFKLTQCPLLRAKLVRLAPDDHALLLTMHHIISDGWSLSLLYKELAQIYEAYLVGQSSPLPELGIQYADFSLWQREWMQGEVLAEQLAYWREQLQAVPPVLALPTDYPRPATQSHQGQSVSFVLDRELTQAVKTLSRKNNATVFMTLLTVFQVLLYRYSGQSDIVVGTPIAGRNREEIESLIGFFVNTLVMRARVRGELSFEQLLEQVKEVALGAYAHQDVPFEKLVEELHVERSLSYAPLFQVLFILQNLPETTLEFGGLQLQEMDLESQSAKFDMTLSLKDRNGELQAGLEYSTDLFRRETVEQMATHFQSLLRAIVAAPAQRVGELVFLSEPERRQLLEEFNDTRVITAESPVTIHEQFEAQVERTPEAVAVVYEEAALSYRELNRRANQVAHYLRRKGVGPEAVVGVLLPRSLELVVSLLGVLKAGAAYLPLDPGYPRERLHHMLTDANVRVLLTRPALLDHVATTEPGLLCIDVGAEAIYEASEANPENRTRLDNLAYVIYTSGSTGKPKGTMVKHGSVGNLRTALNQAIYSQAGREQLRISLNGPLAFDTSVKQLIQLLNGHTLCVLPDEVRRDAEALINYLGDYPVDVLDCTPYMLRLLITAGLLDCPERLPKFALIGGEPIEQSLWQTLARTAETDFYNVYGPTECTVNTTTCRITNDREQPSIGTPIANSQVYLLDQYLQPVPIGVAGELCIGGEGLARGYWRRPELTAEKFVPDQFGKNEGRRLYRTGDRARYLRDGRIEFLGRGDNQVKLRGFRIELGEIEAVLNSYPGICDQVVVMREDQPGDKRLVAYLVTAEQGQPSVGQLRQYLQGKLPDYMVPAAIVHLESFPLTPNGKLDRKALAAPGEYQAETAGNYVPPRNSTEETVANIWSEVLQVQRIGIHDNFFELGGHSLLAMQVISKLRKRFEVEISVRSLFVGLTVAALSDNISQALSFGGAARPTPISRISREQYVAAS